jgi:peroxiredoxin 2/4
MTQILVGRAAPDFTTGAVMADGSIQGQFHFHQHIKNKYAILFFYPLNFTFVCPSELIALDNRIDQFKSLGVEVCGVSIDSPYSHAAWRRLPVNEGGIGAVHYPLISDVHHRICQAYGVEHPVAGVALRAAFVIDKSGIVRAQSVNDLPIGRSIEELIRLVEALQFHELHGEVCPAGWQKGKSGMKASSAGVADYLSKHSEQL